jgi:predicted secreted protein
MRRLAPFALALLLAAPAARAAEPEPAATTTGTVLRLAETAERIVRRDRLRAELRVDVTGPNPRAVQAEINRRMNAAVERVRQQPTVKSETGAHSVWEERPPNAAPRWRGMQSLILQGRESADLLALVGELQGDGLAVSGMQHELAPEVAGRLEDELTKAALDRLRERAEKVAETMGLAIVRWKDLRVGNADGAGRPRPPVPLRAAMAAEQMPTPVAEAGEATVRLTVEADVVLEPVDPKRP